MAFIEYLDFYFCDALGKLIVPTMSNRSKSHIIVFIDKKIVISFS